MSLRESSISPFSRRFLLFGLVLAIGITGFVCRYKKQKSPAGYSDSLATQGLVSAFDQSPIAGANAASESSEAKSDTKKPRQAPGMRFDLYDSYLDKLCPSLTEAEEDRLLAVSGRDVKVLMGLVFAGSARSRQWLKEALLKAPDDPLVHYAILSKVWPEFDHLHSALELAKLTPNDAAPLHAAAAELLKRGDRAAAMTYLTKAAELDQLSSLSHEALDTAINLYRLAGRTDNDARTRVLLQQGSNWEAMIGADLNRQLRVLGPDGLTLWGSDEATSLLINARQQAISSPSTDFGTYTAARMDEITFFRAIAASPADRLAQYLPAPAAEMLANAQAGLAQVDGIGFFAHDKPGIYYRLDEQQKSELINRIYRDGEVSAYVWAYKTRPDIFRSPEFVPQGVPPEGWVQLLKRDGPMIRP